MSFEMGPALLFCPGDRPGRFTVALERADAVIIDLEDAVAPDAKDAARHALVASRLDPARTIVRVNPVDSDEFEHDVLALSATAYNTVMLSKMSAGSQAVALAGYQVIALCETAAGVLAAPEIAAEPNVIALMWGAEDLVASLGGTTSRHPGGRYRDIARQARSQVQLAAGAHGKAAIDAVHLVIDDLDGLRDEATDAVASGFAATACIHPAQVAVIREAYRPSPVAVEHARAIIAASHGTHGVFVYDGRMIDSPVLKQAEALLRRSHHAKSGLTPDA